MADDSQHPTKLAAWLAEAPVKMKDVAARAGMTPEHLRNIAAGIRGCTYEKAEKLSTITGGVVSVADIMSKAARQAVRDRRGHREGQARVRNDEIRDVMMTRGMPRA